MLADSVEPHARNLTQLVGDNPEQKGKPIFTRFIYFGLTFAFFFLFLDLAIVRSNKSRDGTNYRRGDFLIKEPDQMLNLTDLNYYRPQTTNMDQDDTASNIIFIN